MTIEQTGASHGPAHETDRAIIRESITMGLYITISLLGVLTVQPEGGSTASALTIVWGTTVGLALAHWLAFHLTAQLFADGELPTHDRRSMAGQALAAIAVAALTSVPILLLGGENLTWSRTVLAGLVGLFAFGSARRHGGSVGRALLYGAIVMLIATAVALSKHLLTGH